MEGVVENSLEAGNYIVDKYFDKGWQKYQRFVNGKKVEESYRPAPSSQQRQLTRPRRTTDQPPTESSQSTVSDNRRPSTAASRVLSSTEFSEGAPLTSAVPLAIGGAALGATALSASRRNNRTSLSGVDRDRAYRRDSIQTLQQESETSDRILREYELEVDDPSRKAEEVLPSRELKSIIKRDSVMAYNDNYTPSQAGGGYASNDRPRSQPPRSRYYDDDDSDYDERTGRRYASKGSGRGYYDDDREVVYEETERYRGPPANRPWDETRRSSYRSDRGYDEPYGAGAVAQYRRSDGALDRREESYVSRRSKSRGRDRSYSRSRSRSRSGDRERGGGIKEKLEDTFDTSGRGIGIGIAGAVVGGLAGREFGGKQHRQRDVIIGALVGGLGANIAENKYREWKEHKEDRRLGDRDEYEAYGRSRSSMR